MSDAFVIAIDQGTTGTAIHRLSAAGTFDSLATAQHKQIYRQPGWVEHNPEELVAQVTGGLERAAGAAGIGIANQGETVVAWDYQTKQPVYNAIVWQDARTQDRIEAMKAAGHEATTLERAGLPLDPYFSASKLRWILDHISEARDLRSEGRLCLGTSDAFFLDRLAGACVTDVTTASRTSLMNLQTLDWDPVLCELFGVPIECLPKIVSTTGAIGEIQAGAAKGVPVTASAVDQQAALFGHGCRRPGDLKFTFGTGAFALCVTGDRPLKDPGSGLLPTVAWRIADGPATYAVDGGIYNAASAINWARGLGLFSDFREIQAFGDCALQRGLAFVPALSGLGCPYWDRSAGGLWLGLGLETSKSDMMQSILEGIAFRAGQVIGAMENLLPISRRLSIDGGLSNNGYFCEFLAKVLNRVLSVPSTVELTGFGIAQLALIGAGLAGLETLPAGPAPRQKIIPAEAIDPRLPEKFRQAVDRSRKWR